MKHFGQLCRGVTLNRMLHIKQCYVMCQIHTLYIYTHIIYIYTHIIYIYIYIHYKWSFNLGLARRRMFGGTLELSLVAVYPEAP